MFKAKSALKGNPDNIFITEDLTKRNYEMVKGLLTLRKNHSIDSFWTVDGKIYVKYSTTSQPVRIFKKIGHNKASGWSGDRRIAKMSDTLMYISYPIIHPFTSITV